MPLSESYALGTVWHIDVVGVGARSGAEGSVCVVMSGEPFYAVRNTANP
jgi:hypothetical protein